MTIEGSLTSAYLLPRDSFQRRFRYWPSPRQLPYLEQPRIRNS